MTGQRIPPPVLPRLRDGRFLAAGGFADVFRYEQADDTRRAVAVKVLVDQRLTEEVRRQFADEAAAMGLLGRHPNILRVLWTETTADGRPYLVMDLCEEADLGRRGRMPVGPALRVGVLVAGAVEYAHRNRVLHRDIKPANILMNDGWPLLTDFGIAAALTPHGTAGPDAMSVPWSPPEVLFGGSPVDERSDVYSLAATVVSLLTGRSPYQVDGGDNSSKALMERIGNGPLPPLPSGLSHQLDMVLRRALAKDPAGRPARAADFGEQLRGVEQALGLPGTTMTIPGRVDRVEPPQPAPAPAPGTQTRIRPRQERERVIPGAPPVVDTQPKLAERPASPAPAAAAPPPRPRRRGALVAGIVGAVVAAAAVTVGVVLGDHGGGTPNSQQTLAGRAEDAVPDTDGPVPTPVVVAARNPAGGVRFTWTYDHPATGDYFKAKRTDGAGGPVLTLHDTSLTVDGDAHPCLDVTLFRANGQGSLTPGHTCAS